MCSLHGKTTLREYTVCDYLFILFFQTILLKYLPINQKTNSIMHSVQNDVLTSRQHSYIQHNFQLWFKIGYHIGIFSLQDPKNNPDPKSNPEIIIYFYASANYKRGASPWFLDYLLRIKSISCRKCLNGWEIQGRDSGFLPK